MHILFWLLVGHSLADYPLQGDFLSRAKRSDSGLPLPWWLALATHSLIHAGVVALITGSIVLGLCEFVVHCVIDYAKCEGLLRPESVWFSSIPTRLVLDVQDRQAFVIDQALHVAFKVLWVAFV